LPPDAPLNRGAFVLHEPIIFDQPSNSVLPTGSIPAAFFREIFPTPVEKSISRKPATSSKYKLENTSLLTNLQKQTEKEKQTTLIPEIPNPSQDKLIVILNFIIREVIPLNNRQEQKDLLVYFFRSILSETQKLPITHLAYDISQKPAGNLALYDDLYKLRPDLLQICEEAVESIAINQAEKARYGLEKKQIENLLQALQSIFSNSPHALISLLAKNQSEIDSTPSKNLKENRTLPHSAEQTTQELESKGWKTLSPTKSFTFIQPDVRKKMGIENHAGSISLGPKYLYVMPQSAIHEGNLSIIVIAQPVFIPELNRFILLHDQHMAPKGWDDHTKLFRSLGKKTPSNFENLEFAKKEEFIMNTLITLPENLHTKTASETFFTLFPEKKFFKRLQQKITRNKIKKMESSLEEYAELLLDVVEKETTPGQQTSPSSVQKLENFMKRVVLAGILDTKKISTKKRFSLFEHFKKFGNLDEEAFALSLSSSLGFSSAIKAFDTSLVECVALSPFSSVQQLANLQANGALNPASLSRMDLSNFIGNDRAKEWKMGSCLKCGTDNTWIGECSWCLNCEMNYDSSGAGTPSTKKFKNNSLSEKKPPTKDIPTSVGLGSFVAGLI
jgi:hypothetical protein